MSDWCYAAKRLLVRLKNLQSDRIRQNVEYVKENTGKSGIRVVLDMIYCFVRYGAGYVDYRVYNFANLPAKLRNTYLTRNRCQRLMREVNHSDYEEYFDSKIRFNQMFDRYLGRSWIDLSSASIAQIAEFLEMHGQIYFLKPAIGEGGKGIERIDLHEAKEDIMKVAQRLKESGKELLEEALVQHAEMSRLHPESVNCLRITTILDRDNTPQLLYVMQKIGMEHHVTDNYSMYAVVDPMTGEIVSPGGLALAVNSNCYETHPQLHYQIAGCHIPYVKEAVRLCLEAATVVPKQRFIGWDVAICPDGPVLVEGNNYPGCYLEYQAVCASKRTEGLMTEIKKYI